jgi:AcrR family transcriptional regulator
MPADALLSASDTETENAWSEGRRLASSVRREAILVAAARLFAESSYAATGMNDIGAAVGITGGAVYRHFESKYDVLHAIVVRALDRTVARIGEVVDGSTSPEETLDALVVNLVRTTLENRTLVRVFWRERHHLDAATETLIDRAHRLHVAEWLSALSRVRPELTEGERWTLVHAVYGATMWGVEYDSGLGDERLAALLIDAGRTTLLSGPGSASEVFPFSAPRR